MHIEEVLKGETGSTALLLGTAVLMAMVCVLVLGTAVLMAMVCVLAIMVISDVVQYVVAVGEI